MRQLWNEPAVLIGAGLVLLLMVATGGPPNTVAMAMPTLLVGGFLLGFLTRKQAVGGWLFVYFWGIAVTWVVGTPFFLTALLQSFSSVFGAANAVLWTAIMLVQFAATVALFWASVRMLFRRTPTSLLWVRRALWVTLGTLGIVLGIELLLVQTSDDKSGPIVALRPMLTTLVWMLYFERSKRVRRFAGQVESSGPVGVEVSQQTGGA